jgi:hypothetical protein
LIVRNLKKYLKAYHKLYNQKDQTSTRKIKRRILLLRQQPFLWDIFYPFRNIFNFDHFIWKCPFILSMLQSPNHCMPHKLASGIWTILDWDMDDQVVGIRWVKIIFGGCWWLNPIVKEEVVPTRILQSSHYVPNVRVIFRVRYCIHEVVFWHVLYKLRIKFWGSRIFFYLLMIVTCVVWWKSDCDRRFTWPSFRIDPWPNPEQYPCYNIMS